MSIALTHPSRCSYPIALSLLWTLACSGSSGTGNDGSVEGSTHDAGRDGPDSAVADASTDASTDASGSSSSNHCRELGLTTTPLQPGGGAQWGELAGDFEADTLAGAWKLAEHHSGCDSYLFIHDLGDATSQALRASFDSRELFERSPRNVHYFFLSSAVDPLMGAQRWLATFEPLLSGLDEPEREFWRAHLHFVSQPPSDITGSTGAFFSAHPHVRTAAIDRFQRWDWPNSTSEARAFGFVQSGSVLGYTARWYNFLHAQQEQLDAQQDVTEVVLLDQVEFAPDGPAGPDGPFANAFNNRSWSAEFPEADVMAQFDHMQVVVSAHCGPAAGDDDCGHWDYEAFVHWCDNAACDGELLEVIRWITPYARAGHRRWVFEATPMLALLQAGGTQHFRFGMRWNMNPSTWDIRFRLSNRGAGLRPVEVQPAFVGNDAFNDSYNDWASVEFTPPEDTRRVELVALISGHGQSADNNCAEWCEHQHEFTLNGEHRHVREFTGQVGGQRCAEAVDQGVVPGQWGNWMPGRAGWCPGAPVAPWIVDLTEQVRMGESNQLDYRGLFNGAPPVGDQGRILLSSALVYYE